EVRMPRLEGDKAEFFATSEHRAQKSKGRGHCFGKNIDEDFQNDRAETELCVVEAAFDRQIQLDSALSIFEQGHSELDRQVGGVRAVVFWPQCQLVHEHSILRLDLLLCDFIVERQRELSFLQRVAGEFFQVRSE